MSLPESTGPDPVRFPACVVDYYPPTPGWAPPTPVSWPTFTAEVLALYAPPLRAKNTCRDMERTLDQVGELLGPSPTTAGLTPELVARFLTSRPPHQSQSTTYAQLARVRVLCNYASDRRYVAVSPFTLRKRWMPKPPTPDRKRHHSAEDIRRVIDRARLEAERKTGWARWRAWRTHAVICTAAYTGARKMEILRLKVEDIDLDRRVISLVARDGLGFKTPKSAQPIPMPAALAEVLASWLPQTHSEWAFPATKRDRPWTSASPGYRPLDRLKRVAKRAGVEGFTFLSLRHSWATHAESLWGLTEAQIQRVLRHTTPMTQRHYRHNDAANMRAATDGISFGEGR
jgi:integrase